MNTLFASFKKSVKYVTFYFDYSCSSKYLARFLLLFFLFIFEVFWLLRAFEFEVLILNIEINLDLQLNIFFNISNFQSSEIWRSNFR